MTNLIRLETLIIDSIISIYIEDVVNHLSSLPVLSSLVIISIGRITNQSEIYQKIFRLPTLKYCQTSLGTLGVLNSLPVATSEFSPIEHLVINGRILRYQIGNLLSYAPQLRRLSLGHLDRCTRSQAYMNSISLNYLTHVSLKLCWISFEDFDLLVRDFFRQVQVLHITVDYVGNLEYINAERWERLISSHMPNLRVFDFQHQYNLLDFNEDRQTYESRFHQFNSTFWLKRQWFFEYQYQSNEHSDIAVFYTINPYR